MVALTWQVFHSSITVIQMGTFDADRPAPNPPVCKEKSGILSWLGTGGFGLGSPALDCELCLKRDKRPLLALSGITAGSKPSKVVASVGCRRRWLGQECNCDIMGRYLIHVVSPNPSYI